MMTSPSPSASMPAADDGDADLGVVGHDPDAIGAGGLAAYPVPPPRDILDA
ncbi:MAG TPA: transcriptional regulator, partial [Mycobacterium sp.]